MASSEPLAKEIERLAVLREYGILDTPPEEPFDRIIRLARGLFGSPIVLITFVDEKRLWFKSRHGVTIQEAPRTHGFTEQAIQQTTPLVIPDALADPRFADNPLVTGEPKIRFYAGAPIRNPEGHALGAVCVLSPTPNDGFQAREREWLTSLAEIAASEMELRRQLRRATRHVAERDHWQHAEAASRLTALALEQVGVGIMVVNPAGRISMFNSRARTILGFPPEIAPGSRYTELIDWQRRNGELSPASGNSEEHGNPEDAEHVAPGHETPETSRPEFGARPWSNEPPLFRRTLPDGRIIETRTEGLEDGTTVRTFADITAAEQAQATLTEARDAAEAAVRARAQFLAAMSHEIRTPLNGVLGVNELLQATPLADDQREYTNIIQQAGTHLLEMLTEILDYSKIDQHGIRLEAVPFDPDAVLQGVVSLLRSRAAANDLRLETTVGDEVPHLVMGDSYRVRQVLLNLISNAIKFTPSGGVDVTLTGRGLPNGGWWLDFAVKDTGIGIDPDAMGKLFQEFTQSEGSISRRFGGTGLGLAICRRVVQAMGGTITVESTPGEGSLFRFGVPVGAATANVASGVSAGSAQRDPAAWIVARSPTVLLVEDNQINRLVARHMLERSGCKVITAQNGSEAVNAVRQCPIDLVLMDVMMPEMDGLAATRAIRALPPPLNGIPIIGLSANAFGSDERDGRDAGMNSFLTKPIDHARLTTAVAAMLNKKSSDPSSDQVKSQAMENPLEHLRETLGEDTARAVIAVFRDDAPKMLRRLREQAAAGSGSGVAREAHALAGTAGAMGMMALSEQARAVERAIRQDRMAPDETAITRLETGFNAVIEALRAEVVP